MSSSLSKHFGRFQIPLKDILSATDSFSNTKLIGESDLRKAYRGNLSRYGQQIDVVAERLTSGNKNVILQSEISILSSLDHENLVSFIGFCDEDDEKIMIYKHEANESLEKYLGEGDPSLTWMQRLEICVGVARAIGYIHYDKNRNFSVIHCNITSSQILLDANLIPKLSGFKFSEKTAVTRRHRLLLTNLNGMMKGCIDPSYEETRGVSHKTDVYSLGVVLFEVLCGRIRSTRDDIIDHYENGTLKEMIDPDILKQMDKDSLNIFSGTAYDCLKEKRAERPHIDEIIIRLEQALDQQRKVKNSVTIIKEKVQVAPEVEAKSTNHLKWEGMEHLMIRINDIQMATQDFTQKPIGYGGFGEVFKTNLEHFDSKSSSAVEEKNLRDLPKILSTVAVKRMTKTGGTAAGISFATEIKTLTSCNHPNIVSLLGFCDKDPKMFLVYEYVPNGSLDDILRHKDIMTTLTWAKRLQICLDIAEGLNYLHTQKKIIHRDIKSANILLDQEWRAKIADFGLSKIIPESQEVSYLVTNLAGTDGYLDPDYQKTKILKAASDVYSFGVVLFEIVSGTLTYDRRYNKEDGKGLAHYVRQYLTKRTLTSVVDPIIKEEIDENIFTQIKGPNKGSSLDICLDAARKCLAVTQADRPKIGDLVSQIKDAIKLQEKHTKIINILLEDIKSATNNFNDLYRIGRGEYASLYKGEVTRGNRRHEVVLKRLNSDDGQDIDEFLTELDILCDYVHESFIGLLGYCNEKPNRIIVYDFASRGSLDRNLKDYGLTWIKRLQIGIDIARGLAFLHGTDGFKHEMVIHRDIKSASILLTDDWKAKICDFGLSAVVLKSVLLAFDPDETCGTISYRDPMYSELGYLTEHSDIYSFGVVLIEILCGRSVDEDNNSEIPVLIGLFKHHYENGTVDEIVFGGIKDNIVPESLATYQKLAYECLYDNNERRPTADEVLLQLMEALDLQRENGIWKPKLPNDYEEIFKMSNYCDVYSTEKKINLYMKLYGGIFLQHGKVLFSVGDNGERYEMISARNFLYKHQRTYKWRAIPNSRFPKVAKMSDISNLQLPIRIRPQFIARDVNYSVNLIFKFCGPHKFLAKEMYVNLKYKMGKEILHANFATWRDKNWMMIELCRFSDHNNTDFEFLLESFSPHYCGSRAIYIQGIEFKAINNVQNEETDQLEKVPGDLDSYLNKDQLQKLPSNPEDIFNVSKNIDGDQILSMVNGKKELLLSAKAALLDYPSAMHSQRKSSKRRPLTLPFEKKLSTQSRFGKVIELLPQQVFNINCRIKSEWLSGDTDYACYLVFKISDKCIGLHCPVKVRDLLLRKNKAPKNLYFRSPSPGNLYDTNQAPKQRPDGWMEVKVWIFNSKHELKNDHYRVNLKLISYEGTMSGLVVCGLEFRATKSSK